MSKRPTGATGLSPQARVDRGTPKRRIRCFSGQSLDRAPNRMEHQEIHPDRSPLPHSPDPRRTPHPQRRGPLTRRQQPSTHCPEQAPQRRRNRCAPKAYAERTEWIAN